MQSSKNPNIMGGKDLGNFKENMDPWIVNDNETRDFQSSIAPGKKTVISDLIILLSYIW